MKSWFAFAALLAPSVQADENPEYGWWAHHKAGAWVKLRIEAQESGVKILIEGTHTLLEISKDNAVVEQRTKVTIVGKARPEEAGKTVIPRDKDKEEDPIQVESEGDEEIEAGGRKLKCRWIQGTQQKGLKVKFWISREVPGGVARGETSGGELTGVMKISAVAWGSRARPAVEAPVDLLRLLDPKQDAVDGEWTLGGGRLASGKARCARIQFPFQPPEEYDLTVVATRVEGNEALVLGLVGGGSQFDACVDSWNSTVTGLGMLDGKHTNDNETSARGKLLRNGTPAAIVCSVRRDGLTLTVDGRKVIAWKGDYARLSNIPEWKVPDPKALYLGCCDSKFVVLRAVVAPLSGPGQKLR